MHVYTSRLQRCIDTGAAIARACRLAAGDVHSDLNDIDYGRWQFRTHEDAKADDPALFAAWFATPQLVRFRAASRCWISPRAAPTRCTSCWPGMPTTPS